LYNCFKGGEMKKFKRIIFSLILTFAFLFSFALPAYAWNSHGLTLSYCIDNVYWLSQYSDITITEYSYGDVDTEPCNPDFKIQYLDGKIGEKTTAAKILITYADEPDWDMDTNLNLSKFQMLTGGSQGFRHQYYQLFFIRLGVGPKRAQYWYDLAKVAYQRGDLYWTFRFLARAIHHIEDLTCPYHTIPAPAGIIVKNIVKITKFIMTAANHHYNMEEYQGLQIELKNENWLTVLKSASSLDVKEIPSVEWLGKYAAKLGRNDVRKLWPKEDEYFGENLSSGYLWLFDKASTGIAQEGTVQKEYDEIILVPLARFSSFSQTLLNYAKSDLGL